MIEPSEREPRWKRRLFLFIAIVLVGGLWFFLNSFLAPAPGRPGIDENAYLVGGRMIAQHGSTGFKPSDDYQYVGAMWIRAKSGWYYPKYPYGSSLLNAFAVMLHHPAWAFSISPICTCLATLGIFFLGREIVGSFYALLAMIALAMGPTTLQLADIANSHAQALCMVVWGMFFLLRWWQNGRWQLGMAAGLLLGYAVTIRYTEALLLFPLYGLKVINADGHIGPKLLPVLKVLAFLPLGPIGIAAIARVKWKSWRSYFSAAVPVIAWGVPVGALVLFNWFTVGHLTGYDTTNESSGFSIDNFLKKWDFGFYQLYLFGMFIFAPLGIAGLILMFRSARRAAALMTLWFVPGTLLYLAYYWGDDMPGIGFLRFFLTLFPPLIIGAMFLLKSAEIAGKGSIVSPLAAGILTAASAAIGLYGSLGDLERQHRGNLNLHYSAEQILAHVKPSAGGRPMILADAGLYPQLLQYMQFMLDADWYASDVFSPRLGGGFGIAGVFQKIDAESNDKAPVVLQKDRIEYIDSVRKGKTDADFVRDEQHLMDQATAAGRKIYVVLSPLEADAFRKRYITGGYEMVELTRWVEPCAVRFPEDDERNWLALPIWGDSHWVPWHPESRAMFEIRRAATTQPASQATTMPGELR